MRLRTPSRLAQLLLGAALLVAALVWVEWSAWRHLSLLRAKFQAASVTLPAASYPAGAREVVAETDAALLHLQRLLLLSLLGLAVGGAGVVVLFYRWKIAPLRSDLRQSQAIIERQEKLASLGVFATGIAHEIRNPLTAIKVRVFSLKASLPPGSSDQEDLEVIENEIDRLERIVRDFLQFARPAEPDFQIVPAARLLQDAAALLTTDLARRSIRIHVESDATALVRADPAKMKQVLINFMQNAAESMKGGGVITLRARLDRTELQGRTTPVVVLDIADNGSGIPPEVRKRLFDPFFTTKEAGTGLGLCISARLVEKHGGIIHYETELNHGTTFNLVLPLATQDAQDEKQS